MLISAPTPLQTAGTRPHWLSVGQQTHILAIRHSMALVPCKPSSMKCVPRMDVCHLACTPSAHICSSAHSHAAQRRKRPLAECMYKTHIHAIQISKTLAAAHSLQCVPRMDVRQSACTRSAHSSSAQFTLLRTAKTDHWPSVGPQTHIHAFYSSRALMLLGQVHSKSTTGWTCADQHARLQLTHECACHSTSRALESAGNSHWVGV